MRAVRLLLPAAAALSVSACFGGAKPPPTLLTLTPSAPPVTIQRSASAGQAVTIEVPLVSREIRQVRVPVLERAGEITYIKGLQYVATPDTLFQALVSETVRRTTNRVVLEPGQTTLDPGIRVSGTLQRFGYDVPSGQVIVTYDATLSTQGGTQVQTRRFEATAPANGTAASVGPALNQAANAVATQVAGWVGS